MSWIGIVLLLAVVVIVLLPPKYDPAIRWKERNEHGREGLQASIRNLLGINEGTD